MNKFNHSKIYKIVNNVDEMVYVGIPVVHVDHYKKDGKTMFGFLNMICHNVKFINICIVLEYIILELF